MDNQCTVLPVREPEPCKQESVKQQLYIQEVETETDLQKLPNGVIGVLSASIIKMGLHAALIEAAAGYGVTLVNEDIPFKRSPPPIDVIDHLNTFVEPYRKHKKIKSSKGKTNYPSNFTPKKKKRSKRK